MSMCNMVRVFLIYCCAITEFCKLIPKGGYVFNCGGTAGVWYFVSFSVLVVISN